MPIDGVSASTFSSPYNPDFFQPVPRPSAPAEAMQSSAKQSAVSSEKSQKNNHPTFVVLVNYAVMGVAMATFAKLYELKSCFDWFLVGTFIISVYRALAKPQAVKQLEESSSTLQVT